MLPPSQYPLEFRFDYLLNLVGQHETQYEVERFMELVQGAYYNYFEINEPLEEDEMNFTSCGSELLGFSLEIGDNRMVQHISFVSPQFYLKQEFYYPFALIDGITVHDDISEIESKLGIEIKPNQQGHFYLTDKSVMFSVRLDFEDPRRISAFDFISCSDPSLKGGYLI